MEFLISLLLITLLVMALRARKKADKTWLQEERYEESGRWLDKRAGERGTYGSLDREMESERTALARETRINGLALLLRDLAAGQASGERKKIGAFKPKAQEIITLTEKWLAGSRPPLDGKAPASEEMAAARKKQVLQYLFQEYPKLLELEVGDVRAFDGLIGRKI